jgi:phage gp45-like
VITVSIIQKMIAHAIKPLQRQNRLTVSRGTIISVDDGHGVQTMQIRLLDGEIQDGVEVLQNYGMASTPQPGTEAVAVAVGGVRGHMVVIAHGNRQYRLKGRAGGEVALHDDQGAAIVLARGGIVIEGGGRDLTISGAPNINIVGGSIHLDDGDVVAGGVSLRHHTHISVQPGSGESGEPAA